ncbi:MAG: hypothetical protein HC831_03060 [Chloroflexia bacterium]|nr:hypothetical protein [Chloroflexia bacterium]
METPYSVKFTKKEQLLELTLEPFSFESIVNLFGRNQLIFIDQLFLFQHDEDKIGDYDYNEDFFKGLDITLEMFHTFLDSIGEYEIFSMAFEIEDGTCFTIDEGTLTIMTNSLQERNLRTITDLLTSADGISSNYQKAIENQGRYVYFKKTPDVQIISNNDLWYKFEMCAN